MRETPAANLMKYCWTLLVSRFYPGVSQSVDGVLWEHEARGSSPFTWTIKILTAIFNNAIFIRSLLCLRSILFNLVDLES